MASRISASLGSGEWSSSQRAVIIMPGVQNPHWSPWQAMKPCWTGSSWPLRSRPSTVRMSRPLAMAASAVHAFSGAPSSHSTQAPQVEVSQPQWLPVSSSSSRMKWMSSMRGSTSRVYSVPFTVIVISTSGRPGPGRGPAQGPGGQLAGQVTLVVDRTALIGSGLAVSGGDLARLGERRLVGGLAAQEVFGLDRDEVLGADRGQPEAHLGHGAVGADGEGGGGRGHRPVADPAGHLLVGAAVAGPLGPVGPVGALGPDRDPQLGQQ